MVRFLYRGSPRALLFIDFAKGDWASALPHAHDAKLWYELFTYKGLVPYFHLFRENEIIKERDVLPGFPSLDDRIGNRDSNAVSL
jgi:hypothetical protein